MNVVCYRMIKIIQKRMNAFHVNMKRVSCDRGKFKRRAQQERQFCETRRILAFFRTPNAKKPLVPILFNSAQFGFREDHADDFCGLIR